MMNTTPLPRTCSYALLNIMKNIFVRSETAEPHPETEPEPDHQEAISIKRWGTRERKEIRGIWVARVKLEEMKQLNLLTKALWWRGALHEKRALATHMQLSVVVIAATIPTTAPIVASGGLLLGLAL